MPPSELVNHSSSLDKNEVAPNDNNNNGNREVKIGFVEVPIEEIARDIAERRLTIEGNNLKGFRGFLTRVWKYNLFYEYFRQREISKAKKEILESGNIYVGEGATGAAHQQAVGAILERFISGFEEAIHTEAGEKVKILDGNEKEVSVKNALKQLIIKYASGQIDDVSFESEKNRILCSLREMNKEIFSQSGIYVDNLKKLADQVRLNIEHGAGIEDLDFNLDLIVGRAKAGVRTEAQFNTVDRLVKKITETKVGRFLNEATVSSAVAIAYSLIFKSVPAILRVGGRALGFGTMAVSGIAGGLFSGLRESVRLEEERRQHFREMASGRLFERGSTRREEMESFRYETKKSVDLITSLENFLEEANSTEDPKKIPREKIENVLTVLAEVESRIMASDTLRVDFISFSDPTNIEQERLRLDILRAKVKVFFRENQNKLSFSFEERKFDDYLRLLVDSNYSKLRTEEFEKKNRLFEKMKKKKVAEAVLKGTGIGVGIGFLVQEGLSVFNDKSKGFLEGIFRENESLISERRFTALEGLRRWILGDWPRMDLTESHQVLIGSNSLILPKGVDLIEGPNNTYSLVREGEVLADNLIFDENGNLSEESLRILENEDIRTIITSKTIEESTLIQVSSKNYVENHPSSFRRIVRELWYDNDTRMYRGPDGKLHGADLNELKLWWGGKNNIGLDDQGNFVFSVKEMTSDGSFHKGFSANPIKLISEGKLKLILSLSQDTQGYVFEIPINQDGEAIIPKDSEVAKILFRINEGRAEFLGKFAEVVELSGEKDGVGRVKVLATYVGEGVNSIQVPSSVSKDVFFTHFDVPASVLIDLPPIIPIYSRKPLEATYKEISPLPYYYDKNEIISKEEFISRFDEKIIKDPNLDVSSGDIELLRRYFKRQDPNYLKELEEMIEGIEPMSDKIEAVITIPAYHEEANIERTLENYAKLKNKDRFEIVIFENYTKESGRDRTSEIIDEFRRKHPEMKIILLHKAFDEKVSIGKIRKYLVDCVLLKKLKAGIDKSIIIVSNDADLQNIKDNYVDLIVEAFKDNKDLDAIWGKVDYPTDAYKKMPLLYAVKRLEQYLTIALRHYSNRSGVVMSPHLVGCNSAFRSGIYAAIGGYNPLSYLGEDLEIGWGIVTARKSSKGRVSYLNRVGVTTSPRRLVYKLKEGAGFINQYDDFHSNEKVRRVPVDSLLETEKDLDEEMFAREVQSIFDYYKRLFGDRNYFVSSFDRAMRFLGVKYKVEDGKVLVLDISKLRENLKKLSRK